MTDELTSLYDDPQTPQQPRSVDTTPNPDLDSLYSDKPSVAPQRTAQPPKPRNRDQHLQAIRAVNPEFADTAQRFIDFATGKGLTDVDIRSGYRTAAEQNYLNTHGYPTKGNDGYANISPHQQGRAIDWTTRNPANKQRLHDLMQVFVQKEYERGNRLFIPSDEPWHMAGPRSRTAPDPGLNDLYGGDSAAPSLEQATPQPATSTLAAQPASPVNGVRAGMGATADLPINDAAWHFGMTPEEAKILNRHRKARQVLADAVAEDDRKRAAGEVIQSPTLRYQNEMRAKAGLKPLSFNTATDANGISPYYQPEIGRLPDLGMEQRGGFALSKPTEVQQLLRTPVTDQDTAELSRQQQARLQQAQHYGFNSNADYEQWIDKMSQGYGGANLRQSAEQEIGIRAGLLKQAQMTGQDAEDIRSQTHQLSSSLLSSLFDRSATSAASIVPGIWQVMGDLTDSESVKQLAVEGRKEINKRLIANRMAQGERGLVGRSTVGLSNLAGDVLVIAGLSRVVGPTKAMSLYSGLSTLGQTGDYSEAGREGFKGALYGELFKVLPHIEPTQARTLTEKLVNLGVDAGAVATGTYAMERASGKKHDEALQSALTNSLLAGTFRLTDIIPAIPKAAAEKVLGSDSAPEWARRAAEWWTNYQQQAGTEAGTKGFDAAPRVEAAINDIKKRGASPEAKAFFAGIEPRLAGTTISKVKQFADNLGIPWEPDPRWAAAESGETTTPTSAPSEPPTVAGRSPVRQGDELKYSDGSIAWSPERDLTPQQPAVPQAPTAPAISQPTAVEPVKPPAVSEAASTTPDATTASTPEQPEVNELKQLEGWHRSGAVDKYIADGGSPDREAIQKHFNASYGQALDIVDYMNDPARRPSPTLATDSIGRVAESGDSSDRRAGVAAASDTRVTPDEAAGAQAIPTPEKPETIREQLDALYAGRRNAVLITPGEKMHPPRKGYGTVKTAVGTFIYDKKKLAPYDSPRNKKPGIMDAVNNGTYHKLLGIVEPKGPDTTRIVTARTPEGVEAQSAVVSPEREPEQVAQFQQTYPESAIETGGAEQMQRVADEREVAPEGKVYRVVWADGRAVQYFTNKAAAEKFYQEKASSNDEPIPPDLIDKPKGARISTLDEAQATPPVKDSQQPNDESAIVNPIDRTASQEEKVKQLRALSDENVPIVEDLLRKIKEQLGIDGKWNHKQPARVLGKANRPSIKDGKPWFDVEHVRDSLRFSASLNNLEDFEHIGRIFAADPRVEIVKTDTNKMIDPREWGWRVPNFDLRLPNGQLVQFYAPLAELNAKDVKGPNHHLFEKWRDKSSEWINANPKRVRQYALDVQSSYDRYQRAWARGLGRLGLSEAEARAAWTKVADSLASVTRRKLSLRSSAVATPRDQLPEASRSMAVAPPLPSSNTAITRPSSDLETSGDIGTSTESIRPEAAGVPAENINSDLHALYDAEPLSTEGQQRTLEANGEPQSQRESGVGSQEAAGGTEAGAVGSGSAGAVGSVGEAARLPDQGRSDRLPEPSGGAGADALREPDQRAEDGTSSSGGDREERIPQPGPAGLPLGQSALEQQTVKASRNQPRNALLERDYRIDPEKLDFGGKKEKFRLNVAAIQTLKQIEAEGRSYATPEEQEKLVRYVGWGGLPEVFNRWQTDAKWKKEHDQIVRLLGGYDSEEYGRAMDSTKNAHFTSPEVVGAIWQMVKRLGFEGGRTLEPALGTGNFLGMMPPEIHGNPATTMKGIELDPLTGRIAQLLYPSASINIQSFQDYDIADNYYDLVTSNVPFSETTQIADKRYAHLRTMLHDYFFVKSLDKVRPGGLIAFITSTGTMDRQRSDIRKAIAEKADLVAAFRLPDTAFKKNAGTEVATDLLILRKHTSQKPIPVGGGAQQLNFKHADELTTAERYADEEPSHAWFRIQDATKPLPDRSTNWWTGSQDEHPFMDGVSAFINLETASRDLLGGDDVDGLGVNYAEGINEHGGSAILSIFAGTDQGDESPNVNGFSVFDEPNTEVRFSPEEVLAAWKTALLKEYPEDSKDVEEMDWDDLREAYNLSDFDVDAFHALRSVANERKRGLADNKWVDTKTMKLGGRNLQVNEYYHEHPENMLGTATASIKMYGPGDSGENARFALRGTDDFPERLETAIESLPQGVYRPFTGDRSEEIRFPAPEEIKQGAWLVRDGKLFRKHSGELVQQDATADRIARVEAMIPVRQAIRELFLTELGKTKAEVGVSRERLNKAYDAFVEKHGPLNSKANVKAFAGDPDGPMLLKLERPTKDGKYNKADIFRKSVVKTYDKPTKADSVNDAVGISLNETARLDLNRMGELLSRTPDQIEEELIAADLGYRDPLDGWVVKDEYLSGNLKKKLLTATEAAKTDDLYQRNVDALTQAIKEKLPDVDYVDIDARIGANWIPADDLKQFAAELMQISPKNFQIHYLPSSGTWVADSDHGATYNGPQAQTVWGTKRAPFMRILQAALDNKNIAIYDKSGDSSVLNKDATEAANAKVKELKEQFKDWVWQDDERRTRLHRYYNDNFNNIVNRTFDGQHLTLPGLSPEWQAKLRPHVKDAVWRVISTGKMLGGHEVGTGKTAVMVISSMELKRLGLARKSMIGGLNSTISGLAKEAREMYPNINLLVLGEKDIDAKQRNLLMADIASSDYDLVIMGHSHIDMLPVLPETQAKYIREEMNELEAALTAIEEDAHESGPANESNADRVKRRKKSRNAVVKQLAKAKEKLEEKLKAALASKRDNVVYFEQTGIDNIAIDEAHKYKAVPVYTKRGSVKGIPTSRSDRATNMLMLTRWLQEQNRNRGVSLFSGTLISNALTEVYTLQRFVQWQELKERGIEAFDAWANVFGETTTKLEYTTTGEYKQVTRFNHFTNLPELRRLLGQVMDIRFASDLPGFKRPERKDEVVSVPMSDAQWDYLVNEIRPRAELVKKQGGKAEKGQDNMLSISTDARKSAMDMRLVRPTAYDDPGSKVNEAVAKILRNYQEQPGQTQMLFSDYGINPTEWGFSLTQDIIKKLVKGGIPRDEIINFNELTRSQRGPAIRALDTATARVGIGSTEKMGTGINAQTHLRDLLHIDAPWLPAYVEQRNGRGWRPGNENETVNINTFTTAKSFDTFMWQTVANKQRFIDQFMRGDDSLRSIRDDDTDELSFGQIMAVTSGNPELLFKMQLEDEVNELSRASRRHENQQLQFKDTIKWRQQNITNERKAIKEYTADAATYEKHKDEPFSITIGDKTFKVAEKAKPEEIAKVKAKAGKYLKERADAIYAEYKDAGRYRREELEREGERGFGTYRGFTVQFKPHTGNLYLAGERDYSISWGEDELTALRSMDAVLRQQPGNRINGAESSVAQYEREMKQAEAQLGKPFRDADKLTKKRDELTAVTARLEASTPEVQEAEAADEAETNTAIGSDAEAGGEISVAKASGERRPTTPKKATQPAGKKTFGPGASTGGELSRPSIGDMIDPSLRTPMAQQTKGASEQSPTVSLLNALTQPIQKAAGAGATHGATAASTLATGDVTKQLRGWLHTLAGHSMPKTTLRDRVAGELGARYAASRAAAGPMADLFANDVLTGIDIDQAKFDALLKADNLLSIKDDFEKAGETENADKVNTLFGEPDFPFATEEEMVEYGQTPEVQEALARHIENWDAVIDPMYREAAGIDPDLELPTRGKNFGARVNLNPIVEGVYEPDNGTVVGPKHAGGPGGYLLGTLQRKTPFARKAYGTGQRYLLNYAETIGNTFWKQLEIANKRAFDDALVNTGNAEVHQAGKRVVLPDGEPTKAYPYRRKGMTIPGQEEGSTQGITQQHNIYVRESLAKEYAHAADIILDPYRGNMLVSFNKLMAKIALTGLTDATVHISNLSTVLMQVPGTTGLPLLPEAILSALGRLDIPITAARTLIKSWPEMMTRTITPSLLKNMTQMASLTEINAGRPKHENRQLIGKRLGIAVQGMDRVTRMVMDDAYRNLNRQGLVKDNETQRREFINQVGSYNLRTQGEWIRFLRQTWTSPFVTAGRTFATLGIRGVTLNPGVEASSMAAAAAMRGSMAAKWIGTLVLVGLLNYLINRKLMGRPGTPIGAVDTGMNDKNGNPLYINVMNLTGQTRALRTVGARGAIQAWRRGLPASDVAGAAVRDITNTAAGPIFGPGPRFAFEAASGYQPAVGVPRQSETVAPGESQTLENLRSAAMQANPLLASVEEYRKPGGSIAKAVERQLPRFTLTPVTPAQSTEQYPELVQRAQAREFTDWIVHNARAVPMADRKKWVDEQVNRLPETLQTEAQKEVMSRGVFAVRSPTTNRFYAMLITAERKHDDARMRPDKYTETDDERAARMQLQDANKAIHDLEKDAVDAETPAKRQEFYKEIDEIAERALSGEAVKRVKPVNPDRQQMQQERQKARRLERWLP